jgi:hypothetical protein
MPIVLTHLFPGPTVQATMCSTNARLIKTVTNRAVFYVSLNFVTFAQHACVSRFGSSKAYNYVPQLRVPIGEVILLHSE